MGVSGGPPYLSIGRLTKRFGAFTALDDVSLEVFAREFVVFLGPSGCGKTTLLRAIAGLDIQTAGTIHQDGQDVSSLPPAERDFGIVFQSYALFPNLSVRDNVGYGLVSRGKSRAETLSRVTELLALVGMPDAGPKYPSQLSGGQQQRVALARALAISPGLLLLDEPLSALDARVRQHLRHELKDLQRKLGITTIMVTHDQEEALVLADRIVVMNHGVIEQVGTPTEIYRKPASPFVADFVGTMNFLEAMVAAPGTVSIAGRSFRVDSLNGMKPGTAALICIRPEDVKTRNVEPGSENALEVEVRSLEFLGAFARARLAAADGAGPDLVADFSINLLRDLGVEPGLRLPVALPADRLRAFPKAG
ncbi:MAG: putative 2-aminoethylphosphonate ABC transporter ATP-binding protein [Alphaproteobacteria bacterium]|nr:putative 2-aminoethylphosphonate ABC transporter ATP-binding protein [Alphaproteobacteria bacterium]